MPKPKILIIDNSSGYTGALNSILSIIKKLEAISFTIALPSKKLVEGLKLEGYQTIHIPFFEVQKNWKLILYFPMLLFNSLRSLIYVKKEKIDTLHVNDLYNMIGVIIKFLYPDIKLIYHVRLLRTSYARLLYNVWVRLIFHYADRIICVSDAVASKLPESNKKIVINDAIPIPESKHFEKFAMFTFLYVGNYIPGKGHNYAIEAYRMNKRDLTGSRIVFVGGDLGKSKNKKFKENLINKVRREGLEDKILFYDFAKDPVPFYKSAHVLLNFSESESFSMVTLESLINGTPVIATKCGGPEEIITEGVNGILVENRNVKEMGKAMVTIYQDNKLRKKFAQNAPDIHRKFSIQKTADKIKKIYENSNI